MRALSRWAHRSLQAGRAGWGCVWGVGGWVGVGLVSISRTSSAAAARMLQWPEVCCACSAVAGGLETLCSECAAAGRGTHSAGASAGRGPCRRQSAGGRAGGGSGQFLGRPPGGSEPAHVLDATPLRRSSGTSMSAALLCHPSTMRPPLAATHMPLMSAQMVTTIRSSTLKPAHHQAKNLRGQSWKASTR